MPIGRLERSNGQTLLAKPYVDTVTWTKGIDQKTGLPVDYDPNKDIQVYSGQQNMTLTDRTKKLCPSWIGGNNYWSASYSRRTKLLYIPSSSTCNEATLDPDMGRSATGSMPGGAMPSTWEGTTDASGNFSKSGTVGTGEIGRWHEVWSVGPTVSGSTTFVVTDVTQAPAAPAPVTTPAGKTVINSSGATQQTPVTGPAAGGFSLAESFNCSDPSTCWFGFPKWAVLLAGGALAVFAFRGSHGR